MVDTIERHGDVDALDRRVKPLASSQIMTNNMTWR